MDKVEIFKEREILKDRSDFRAWLNKGIERKWISESFCYTHEGDPYMNQEEEEEWEKGGDPCMVVLKVL
jgi:hypothetical protein